MSKRARQDRSRWPVLVGAAGVGAVAAVTLMLVMRPGSPPHPGAPAPPAHAPAAPTPAADSPALRAPAPPTPGEGTAAPAASRSRGRTEWIFFFGKGDRLVGMDERTPLGLVVGTELAHVFPDGTTGPAYLLQGPDGSQRHVDADELERGARLQ